ncbi:hypothetical protein [Microbacterium sp. AG790]|uniref:hypothetical protein n=1 Tax=Microbacterium sp. AG790 TaxID=2183995 RepID=UPI00160324B1|nr:hypothetical protein [Microbacterium sp. AG790]
MAKNKWNIVKTSGGYGVLKSGAGAKTTKSTVVRPSVAEGQRSGTYSAKKAH